MERLERARISLEGLSVGDAFGKSYFIDPNVVADLISARTLGEPEWPWTDDTLMALSLYAVLHEKGQVDQEWLARDFATRYTTSRGYGPSMHELLRELGQGTPWQTATRRMFEGQGSWGNGAAMRVAPLGAYFADDLDCAAEQAALSAEVTHAHPEAITGAVAVALATALAWQSRNDAPPPRRDFLDAVYRRLPNSIVAERVRLAPDCSVRLAVAALGNGNGVSAQDTVPFALWCAAGHLDDYEEALWLTVSGLGERDTTCAIVGGIVAARTGVEAIPASWREAREPLPDWAFQAKA
jgi:ADP-ribosylglycohydrolase